MRRHHGRAPSPYAGRVPTPLSAEVSLVRNFDHVVNPSRPARQSPLATSQFQGMPLDLIDRIRTFPLFKTAPDSFLYELVLVLKPQMHAPNDYLMTEGDDAKAMWWIVRGAVAVCSRDGESTYAELKQGAFVGEIGILMDRPRTATVIARTRCLTLQLKKEDLSRILPKFPEIERTIREEALERLAILNKKKQQTLGTQLPPTSERRGSKRTRDQEEEMEIDSPDGTNKRRKSPSPVAIDATPPSALGYGLVNVRTLLKELPLFAGLPAEPLHFLGLNAQPRNFAPFTDIIKQNSTGREVYFIVHGEVEVIAEHDASSRKGSLPTPPVVKARLRSGQYFGEVVSLDLAPRRTATVRSVSQVECLVIPENVLADFWHRCPPALRAQIEETAKDRLKTATANDVIMKDADLPPSMTELELDDGKKPSRKATGAQRVTFEDPEAALPTQPLLMDEPIPAEPSDPDPFSSAGLDSVRSRSRRGSLAPPPPDEPAPKPSTKPRRSPRGSPKSSPKSSQPSSPSTLSNRSGFPSPVAENDNKSSYFGFSDPFAGAKRPAPTTRLTDGSNRGHISDEVLILVFQRLDLHELMELRAVSMHWQNLLTTSDKILHHLNLARYNRYITDEVLVKRICPFVGNRPRSIDICNCFHLTDEGFSALADQCGQNVVVWRMKSVWDVTANAILDMSNKAKGLVSVDLSNCRKVSDTLLARIIGWVVPQPSPFANPSLARQSSMRGRPTLRTKNSENKGANGAATPPMPHAGTVIGCPDLSRLTLSYCKHVTDRTMHHLAQHASNRLECLDLTRCTTITDQGFSYWGQNAGNHKFTKLRKLVLADCTYLSDQAIIYLTTAAGSALRHLDLSFCCALSDTSTEVIALGCHNLESLDMSFCGSAVSDASLRSIGNHLTNLRHLAVRGCVRVTGMGVDGVVDGCKQLTTFDVSQCKNLTPWMASGGVERWRKRGRDVKFLMLR